jgi:hypothetical protein
VRYRVEHVSLCRNETLMPWYWLPAWLQDDLFLCTRPVPCSTIPLPQKSPQLYVCMASRLSFMTHVFCSETMEHGDFKAGHNDRVSMVPGHTSIHASVAFGSKPSSSHIVEPPSPTQFSDLTAKAVEHVLYMAWLISDR